MIQSFMGDNIGNDLRVLAGDVHVAGTPQNNKIGDFILNRYKSFGLVHFSFQ